MDPQLLCGRAVHTRLGEATDDYAVDSAVCLVQVATCRPGHERAAVHLACVGGWSQAHVCADPDLRSLTMPTQPIERSYSNSQASSRFVPSGSCCSNETSTRRKSS